MYCFGTIQHPIHFLLSRTEATNNSRKNLMEESVDDFKKALEEDKLPSNHDKEKYLCKMEAPLSLSNANEVRKYARYLIVRDFQNRNGNIQNSRIRYGDPAWEPSTWPNNWLSRTTCVKNFSDMKRTETPGKLSLNLILKEYIKITLESEGKDPETFYDKNNFDTKKGGQGKKIVVLM